MLSLDSSQNYLIANTTFSSLVKVFDIETLQSIQTCVINSNNCKLFTPIILITLRFANSVVSIILTVFSGYIKGLLWSENARYIYVVLFDREIVRFPVLL